LPQGAVTATDVTESEYAQQMVGETDLDRPLMTSSSSVRLPENGRGSSSLMIMQRMTTSESIKPMSSTETLLCGPDMLGDNSETTESITTSGISAKVIETEKKKVPEFRPVWKNNTARKTDDSQPCCYLV
jgi:hypothetical protein